MLTAKLISQVLRLHQSLFPQLISLGYNYNLVCSICSWCFIGGLLKLTVLIHTSTFSSLPLWLWPWMDDERKLMDIKWKNSEMRSMQSIRGSLGIEPLLPTAVTCLILYLYWFSVIPIVTSTFPYQWILASPPKSTICTQLVTVSAFGETRTWAHISV